MMLISCLTFLLKAYRDLAPLLTRLANEVKLILLELRSDKNNNLMSCTGGVMFGFGDIDKLMRGTGWSRKLFFFKFTATFACMDNHLFLDKIEMLNYNKCVFIYVYT